MIIVAVGVEEVVKVVEKRWNYWLLGWERYEFIPFFTFETIALATQPLLLNVRTLNL